jgi:pimeloyl-ACP methyl ester carboxylesterase
MAFGNLLRHRSRHTTLAAALMSTVLSLPVMAQTPPAAPLSIAQQGYFYAGGKYVQTKDGQVRVGQMHVQFQIPAERKHRQPVIMIHGGGQTGLNFLGTPDGRPGWADAFLRAGYAVYVVDQAARGRSGYFTDVYGPTRRPNTKAMSERFTDPQPSSYPQAKLHTQWPGSGKPGDPVFDEFFSSQMEDIADVSQIEILNREAGAALLDKIGPAIVLTHSQGGPIGWTMANDRPDKVSAIIAVEPNGPPFYENTLTGKTDDPFKDGALGRPYGITRTPLTFDPAPASGDDMKPVRQDKADAPDHVRCWLQPEPARKLTKLAGIPILILGSEASYHVPYDHCTAAFLTQAGVKNSFVRLPQAGIHGNGHMMMLEKNSDDIARYLIGWSDKNAR